MIMSKKFEMNYQKGWLFKNKWYPLVFHIRPTQSGKLIKKMLVHQKIPPLLLAVKTESDELVKALLDSKVNVFEVNRDGISALEKTIHLQNKKLFYTITNHSYGKHVNYTHCGIILEKLLKNYWIKEFEYFLEILSMNTYMYFHKINNFHFPFHELCVCGNLDTIVFLLKNYDKDTLNIDCKCDNKQWEPSAKNVTCPEQELIWCLLLSDEFPSEEFINDKKLIINELFQRNYFSDAAIFNHQYDENLMLKCMYKYNVEEGISKVQTFLGKIMTDENVQTLSLQYAVKYYEDPNTIYNLVQKGGQFLRLPFLEYKQPIFDMVQDDQLINTVCLIYQEKHIPVNLLFSDSSICSNRRFLLDWIIRKYYIHQLYLQFCKPRWFINMTKMINVMYVAGEKSNLMGRKLQPLDVKFVLLSFNEKAQAFERTVANLYGNLRKNIMIKNSQFMASKLIYKICPFEGPKLDKELQLIRHKELHENQYVPSLLQISRKSIRDSIYASNKHQNIYDAVSFLYLPPYLCRLLLFHVCETNQS